MSPNLSSPWREFLDELDALRGTNDLDYRTLYPFDCLNDLQTMAGPGSALAQRHKVHVQHTEVESIPESYEDRLITRTGDQVSRQSWAHARETKREPAARLSPKLTAKR